MDAEVGNSIPSLWGAEEVATRLNVQVSTVKKWAKLRRIPVVKVGALNRFDPDEIEAWIAERSATPSDAG